MRNVVTTLSIDELRAIHQETTTDENVAPIQVSAIGNTDILRMKKLALFCSIKCPGSIILQTYDCMKALRAAGVTLIGGFHSPMEKECLNILLRGTQPVIICPGRSLQGMSIKPEYEKLIKEGRLLFLSPFPGKDRRISAERADVRNSFVAALADAVFIAHAQPKSKTERLFYELEAAQRPVFVLASEFNGGLITAGAKAVTGGDIAGKMRR